MIDLNRRNPRDNSAYCFKFASRCVLALSSWPSWKLPWFPLWYCMSISLFQKLILYSWRKHWDGQKHRWALPQGSERRYFLGKFWPSVAQARVSLITRWIRVVRSLWENHDRPRLIIHLSCSAPNMHTQPATEFGQIQTCTTPAARGLPPPLWPDEPPLIRFLLPAALVLQPGSGRFCIALVRLLRWDCLALSV